MNENCEHSASATRKNINICDTPLLCLYVNVPFRYLYYGQGLTVTWECGSALPSLNSTSKLLIHMHSLPGPVGVGMVCKVGLLVVVLSLWFIWYLAWNVSIPLNIVIYWHSWLNIIQVRRGPPYELQQCLIFMPRVLNWWKYVRTVVLLFVVHVEVYIRI
jgi:hypothetical protein